jgi:hypothetical protein
MMAARDRDELDNPRHPLHHPHRPGVQRHGVVEKPVTATTMERITKERRLLIEGRFEVTEAP